MVARFKMSLCQTLWVVMKRLSSLALSVFLFSTPALSCLDDVRGELDGSGKVFAETVEALDNKTFRESYCALSAADQTVALRLFDSAFRNHEGNDRATLARLSIMIPDIRENVAFVAQNGEIREVDDEWESIGIMRLIEHMQVRFPSTKSVLSDSYVRETEALFDAAFEAVTAKEEQSDNEITQSRQTIADYERKIKDLMDRIQSLRDVRHKYRSMRQELELQIR